MQIKTDKGKKGAKLDQTYPIDPSIYKSKIEVNIGDVPEFSKSALLRLALPLEQGRSILLALGKEKAYYRYFRKDGEPIPQEYLDDLVNPTKKPSTKGITFLGSYDPDIGDSRGSLTSEELIKNSQEYGSESDPNIEYWFESLDPTYEHGIDEAINKQIIVEYEEFKDRLYEAQGKKRRKKKT